MADDKRGKRDDIGRDVGQLVGQAGALQADAEGIGEAEEDAGSRGVERIVAPEHDRDHGDPAAPGAHILGEEADRAERELRPGEAAKRAHRAPRRRKPLSRAPRAQADPHMR